MVGPALSRRFRRLRKERKTQLFLFLLQATAQLLPTPDTLLQRPEERSRQNLRCRACKRHRIASSKHALSCTGALGLQTWHHRSIKRLLTQLVAPALGNPAIPQEFQRLLRNLPSSLHWYKHYIPPQACPPLQCEPTTNPTLAAQLQAYQALHKKANNFNRYCGTLGYLPPGLARLAYPEWYWHTLPDQAHNPTRHHIDATLQQIQRQLLLSASKVFTHWKHQHNCP